MIKMEIVPVTNKNYYQNHLWENINKIWKTYAYTFVDPAVSGNQSICLKVPLDAKWSGFDGLNVETAPW